MKKVITFKRLKYSWGLYLLILIPLGLNLVFNYQPIINGIAHIFYRWNGDTIEEFIGFANITKMIGDADLGRSFLVVLLFIASNVIKMIPAIIAAVVLHHIISDRMQYVYRVLFVIPMIIPGMVNILIWKYFYEPTAGILNQVLRVTGYLGPTEIVQWLSDKALVLPSLIFMGFPWIGAFSVLIYLAGLQNIPKDVYESASLDGANAWQIFWKIELPLIVTQIRITLVLMMIGTIQDWSFIYLFLGESGGPGGLATVPGLIIFRKAFSQGFFGYGCAIGFLIFIIILMLTYLNIKFVRVEK